MDDEEHLRATLRAEGLSDELIDLVVERHARDEISDRARSVLTKAARKAKELEERITALYPILVAEPVLDFTIPLDSSVKHPRWGSDHLDLVVARYGLHHISFTWRTRGSHSGTGSIALGEVGHEGPGSDHAPYSLLVARVGKVGGASFDVSFVLNRRWVDGERNSGPEAAQQMNAESLVDFLSDRFEDSLCRTVIAELAALTGRIASYFEGKDRALDGLDFSG